MSKNVSLSSLLACLATLEDLLRENRRSVKSPLFPDAC